MAVDLKALFLQRYTPGPGRLYVSPSGNDANPGTSAGSPKRQIQAAVDAMSTAGGIIYVASGTYDPFVMGKTNSANGWTVVVADTRHGPHIDWGGDGYGVTLTGAYNAVWGLEVQGTNSPGAVYSSGIVAGNGHHLAMWCCHAWNFSESSFAGIRADFVDICYCVAHDSGRWMPQCGSGISCYEFIRQGNPDQYGYHNYIIGNVSYHNWNDPSATANTDGNGIIIDDMEWTQNAGSVYTGKFLVAGNITLDNGGRGVHAPWSSSCVDSYFNTVAHNLWNINALGDTGELSHDQGSSGNIKWNLTKVNTANFGRTRWLDTYISYATTDANVFLAGDNNGTNSRNRSSEGFNYFKNNSPSLAPLTSNLWDNWRPDGGSGAVEKVVLDQATYNALAPWPDMFGDLRPARTTGWAIGALEGSPGGPTPPQAAFTVSDSTPDQGQTVTFTDTSTGAPTSWSWNFGDGSTSTQQNPSKSWSTPGSKTVTLTVSNVNGSTTTSQVYTVSSVTSGPGIISHPPLGQHGHLLTSVSNGTTPGGKPRYKLTYQMTSITGSIVTATAVVALPGAPNTAPSSGWPIILAGHGATGTNDASAPSSYNDDFSGSVGNVDQWLNAGYIVVQADYEGLTAGGDSGLRHPYMVGTSAARSLLDAGLACAGLTTVRASAASVGFSQGGHAALFAGQLADSYAATNTITEPAFPTGTPINITTLGVSAGGGDQQAAIQNAINNAAPGSILLFPAGTYLHSGVIEVNKAITLYSTAGAVLRGTDPLNMAIRVMANDVRIQGLTIEGVGTTRQSFDVIRAGISAVGVQRTVIKGCTVRQSSAAGIYIEDSSNYWVVGNTVEDTLSDSIHQTGSASNGYVLNNTVTNAGDDCIAIVSYDGQDCNNILVSGNTVSGGDARGLSVVGGRDCTLQGNTISTSRAAGIYLASEPSYTTESVSRIMVRDNVLNGCNTDSAIAHGGIFLWGGRSGKPVSDVTIYNNTVNNTAQGAAHLVVQGSNVFGTDFLNNTTTGTKQHRYIEAASGEWTMAGSIHNGSPVANQGTAIPTPAATTTPVFKQFCSVGFDPVITSDYVNAIYNGQNSDQYLAAIIYGQWVENQSLPRTTVLSSAASSALPNLDTWDFSTTASNINFNSGSFIANPVTAGGGWSTAIYNNTPGHRKARPSRVYAPTGGIGGSGTWLGFAQSVGTDASVITGPGGHEIIQLTGAITWVTQTLANQTGGDSPPTANFTWLPTSPQVGESVTFTDTSTNGPTSWVWNFGDGTTSTQQNPTKSWSTTGTKTVSLTVTNTAGTNQTTKTITVVAVGPPVAAFNYSPSPGVVNEPVQFTDATSGAPTSWLWSFGDGVVLPDLELPEGGLNGPGHFSGRFLIDDVAPLAGCLVKVVDAWHPNWNWDPGGSINDVLNGPGASPGYEAYCKVTTTDANGYWSVTGLTAGRTYMLKVFPDDVIAGPSKSCIANAVVPNSAYITGETGFIDYPNYGNFMSTPQNPSGSTYATFYDGRYLFDMPVHIQPLYPGALQGSQGYSDLNIRFYTRTGTFNTMNGSVTGCSPATSPTSGAPSTSTLKNPSHTYTQTGVYTVTLQATNAQGTNTATRTVTIDNEGPGGGGLTTVLQAETLTIIGSGYPGDPSAMHVKDVSPGSTGAGAIGYWDMNGEALQWTYNAPTAGTYTLSARYHSAVGAQRVFKVDGTTVTTMTFPTNATSWDDGTWTQSATVSFTLTAGSHTMQLLHDGTDDTWGLDLDTITITAPDDDGGGGGGGSGPIYQAELANLVGSAYPGDPYAAHMVAEAPGYTGTGYLGYWGLPGENLVFSLTDQTAGQADVVFRYQKGDVDDPTPRQLYVNGTLVTTINFTRTGPDWESNTWQDINPITVNLVAGNNTIELRHTGANYLYVDIDRMVVTPQAPPTPPPVANFTRSPLGSQLVGTTITFTDTSTGTPTSWNWSFGDGATSTAQNPTHAYSAPGLYTITLQAINAGGQSTHTATITITVPAAPPVAAFNASATTVVIGQVITFTDQSTNTPTSWAWTFGDATSSTAQNPTKSYSAVGTYSVTLTATNTDGSDDTSIQIVVIDPPVLDPGDPDPINRHAFTVLAKRPISLSEENDLRRMLNVLKPASTIMNVGVFGATMHDNVPIMRVAADSEWWEIVGSVVTRPGTEWAYATPGDVETPQEQPRPPFSAYQGESWSYTGDIANVLGYAEMNGNLVIDYYQRVQFADGTHFDYRPELGARWPQDAITERLALDGSLVSHPLAIESVSGKHRWVGRLREVQSRTDRSRSGINPLYFNGVSIEDLSQRSDSIFSPHRRQAGVPQRFWVTPEHLKASPIMESIEIRMRTPQRVNRIQFQLAHFPHRAWLEVWSEAHSTWLEIWSTTVVDSVPTNLVTRVDHHHHHHPQHSMAGHWMPFDLDVPPVVGQRFRLRMQRLATGTAPLDSKGRETSYSLGVRGFDLGYVIRSRDDIPRVPLDEPIGNAVDPLGSRVIYSVRERTARMAIDGDSETAWMSEPMPMGNAVVNFYADVRTPNGEGRLIDRWYLDPIKPGPMLNLYYSNDLPPSFLVADDTPLGIRDVNAEGLFTPLAEGVSFDGSDPAYFLVPNGLIQFDHRKDWWVGAEIEPRFAGPLANAALFSFEEYTCQFLPNSIVLGIPSGNDVVLPLTWNPGQILRIVVAYNSATNSVTIAAKVGGSSTVSVTELLAHTMVGYPQHFRIATDPSLSLRADYIMRRFVLNQSGNVDIDDFMDDPSAWIVKSTYAADDTGKTNGALLRLHPDFVNGEDYPFGLVGGPGDGFAAMHWTPIPRDFRLQKGWLDLPPTKARWWKFEFSNLVMEPIEVQTPLRRMVRVFPLTAHPESNVAREDATPDIPGYETFARGWQMYGDAPAPTPEPDPTKVMPTSLLYAVDPSGVQRLRSATWAHGFMPWHVGSNFPRFREEGIHTYDYVSYEHREKVGFFVGLKEIRAALTTYRGVDNSHVIIERFNDASRLTTNQWSLTQGNAWSGASLGSPVTIESMVYPSRNRISGLHFATQQTDAVQLLPDDNFRDPSLFDYAWDDPQKWRKIGDASIEYRRFDQQVLVRRAVSVRQNIDPLDQGITLEPVHPVFALHQPDDVTPQDLGGLESPLVKTSPNGVLHAAARITALTDLTNPLWVQILDEDGTVLVEEPITAKGGDTVEWTASYNLAEYGVEANYLPDYGTRTIVDDPVRLVFATEEPLVDLNGGPGQQEIPGFLFRVRLIQKDNSQDTWLVDRVSLFDESLVWEFSVDGGSTYYPAYNIRNNPNGMLSFPKPGNALRFRMTAYRANIHVSALQIRPIYVGLPTHRFTNPHRGPNVSVYDHYPPIQDDPEFKRWNKPVPQYWWLEGQTFLPNVPVDAYPYSNEFSRSFDIRTADDLSQTFSDTVTRVVTYNRVVSDSVDPVTDTVSITITPA